jgi:hypothetical protein
MVTKTTKIQIFQTIITEEANKFLRATKRMVATPLAKTLLRQVLAHKVLFKTLKLETQMLGN